MTFQERFEAMVKLGSFMQTMQPREKSDLFEGAEQKNAWFTPEQLALAWDGILKMIEPSALQKWLHGYKPEPAAPKKVGVVMAGNIPLVGFHDFLCVILSGHCLVAKLSSQDSVLLSHLAGELVKIEPRFKDLILFEERMNGMDAVIATGSDNTGRYFEYYFRNIPHIIRKNRSSCAVITGEEDASEFKELGRDVFAYFGLGCRNVSKLYVPERFDLPTVLNAWEGFSSVAQHHKYVNNYDYNKSIYLVNQVPFLDTGFVLLTESQALVSPISVVYYERYSNQEDLDQKIEDQRNKIQCIASAQGWYHNSVVYGQAQFPKLNDYADNIDTMQFLKTL